MAKKNRKTSSTTSGPRYWVWCYPGGVAPTCIDDIVEVNLFVCSFDSTYKYNKQVLAGGASSLLSKIKKDLDADQLFVYNKDLGLAYTQAFEKSEASSDGWA